MSANRKCDPVSSASSWGRFRRRIAAYGKPSCAILEAHREGTTVRRTIRELPGLDGPTQSQRTDSENAAASVTHPSQTRVTIEQAVTRRQVAPHFTTKDAEQHRFAADHALAALNMWRSAWNQGQAD